MKTVSFGPDLSRYIDQFGSNFRMTRLVQAEGIHVACMYFEPDDEVGYHPASSYQLFAVVAGQGWMQGTGTERLPIKPGEAAIWSPGEYHAAGSATGMTAIVVETEKRM